MRLKSLNVSFTSSQVFNILPWICQLELAWHNSESDFPLLSWKLTKVYYEILNLFFVVVVGLRSQSAYKLTIHSIPCSWILKADHSSKSTFPFAGIQHMQQCQVRVFHNFCSELWSKCLKNGLHSGGLNPGPLGHKSSALTTRPRNCFPFLVFFYFLTCDHSFNQF